MVKINELIRGKVSAAEFMFLATSPGNFLITPHANAAMVSELAVKVLGVISVSNPIFTPASATIVRPPLMRK